MKGTQRRSKNIKNHRKEPSQRDIREMECTERKKEDKRSQDRKSLNNPILSYQMKTAKISPLFDFCFLNE